MKYKIRKFTIIELIVVIAIIATLMALLMPVMTGVRRKAKETKAKAEMHSIITAIKSYEMTYGILPLPDGVAASGLLKTADGESEYPDLLTFLTNVQTEDADVTGNSRGIRFLDVPNQYVAKGFLDPWEQDYSIYLDTDYDGIIVGPNANANEGQGFTNLYGTVFIYTHSGSDESDTIYSWK